MRKAIKYSVMLALFALVAFVLAPSKDASAGNGPSTVFEDNAYLIINPTPDSPNVFLYAGELMTSYGAEVGTVDGAKYDLKTNTLTLKNADLYHIDTNVMGDDFKIKLVGDNTVGSIRSWGYYYGGNVTFSGKGTLTLTGDSSPLLIQAENSDSAFYFTDSVSVKITNADALPVAVIASQAKNGVNASKKLTTLYSEKVQPTICANYDDDGNVYQMFKKDGVAYRAYVLQSPDNKTTITVCDEAGTLIADNLSFNDLMKAGYRVADNGIKSFFYGYNGQFEVGTSKAAITAPKASVKVSGSTAKFTVKKTKGAEGYEVKITRMYDEYNPIEKEIKKSGSAKRTLSVKKLNAGSYYATVVPYKTVDGEKVYGAESKAVYFEIK
ncbi:MAG: hypothetical protein IK138_10345 [Lachnospiraceae bacterium]|nr:hypothetical protein [Lachnospiraceae bacterium]